MVWAPASTRRLVFGWRSLGGVKILAQTSAAGPSKANRRFVYLPLTLHLSSASEFPPNTPTSRAQNPASEPFRKHSFCPERKLPTCRITNLHHWTSPTERLGRKPTALIELYPTPRPLPRDPALREGVCARPQTSFGGPRYFALASTRKSPRASRPIAHTTSPTLHRSRSQYRRYGVP